MRFTLRQLEYFAAAGETGSITLAAERVKISQPSVSTAISHLEAELGVQLFVRHHAQGLSLTTAGHAVLAEAKRVIAQAEALYAVASEAAGQIRGQLSVGCLLPLAPMLLPEISHSFTAAHPQTVVHQVVRDQAQLLESLRHAEIDVALTYDLQLPEDIAFAPLASLPPHAVVGEDDALAGRASTTLEELAELPLILLDLPHSREYFMSLFLARRLRPRIAARVAHQDVIRTMVANGYGYTLANVRPRADLALDGRRLVRIPLAGEHPPMRIGTAVLARLQKSRLLDAFEAHCRSVISDSRIPGMVAPAGERDTAVKVTRRRR